MTYEGRVYQAKSGQWSWEVTCDGEPIVCGAGYETEDEAWIDMDGALSHYEASVEGPSDPGTRMSGKDYQARYRRKGRQLSVVISPEAYERLQTIASRLGVSMGQALSALVQQAPLPRRRNRV